MPVASCSRNSTCGTALTAFTVMVPVVGLHDTSAVSPTTSSRTSFATPTHADTRAMVPAPEIVARTAPAVGEADSLVVQPPRVSVPVVTLLEKSLE